MRRMSMHPLVLLACAACFGQTAATTPGPLDQPLKRLDTADVHTRNGEIVKVYTLRNANQISVKLSSLGATITNLETPDRNGKVINIASGGVTIGRVANRIAGATFSIDGNEYHLQPNENGNTLHGGDSNFANKMWNGKSLDEKPHESAVQFTYTSKDGDGGFPGTLTAKITFTLNDNNELRLDYEATTDKATLINLTNHAYFNLAGKGPVIDHEVWIDADNYTPFEIRSKLPTGEIISVKGTAFDFTKPMKIGDRNDGAYDNNLVLNSGGKSLSLAARITDPTTGRIMEVRTDRPGLQFYTADAPHTSVCFETQTFPDSVHHANFPNTILKPGETFKSTTIFTFSAK